MVTASMGPVSVSLGFMGVTAAEVSIFYSPDDQSGCLFFSAKHHSFLASSLMSKTVAVPMKI